MNVSAIILCVLTHIHHSAPVSSAITDSDVQETFSVLFHFLGVLMLSEDTGDSSKACVYTLSLQWYLFTHFMTITLLI